MNCGTSLTCWLGVAAIIVASAASEGSGVASEYYVYSDGNDLNPGTQALPFRTIGKPALAAATQGSITCCGQLSRDQH